MTGCTASPAAVLIAIAFSSAGTALVEHAGHAAHETDRQVRATLDGQRAGGPGDGERLLGGADGRLDVPSPRGGPRDRRQRLGLLDAIADQPRQRQDPLAFSRRPIELAGDEVQPCLGLVNPDERLRIAARRRRAAFRRPQRLVTQRERVASRERPLGLLGRGQQIVERACPIAAPA